MRYFEPDETDAVAITMTRKDWLMILLVVDETIKHLDDSKLREGYRQALTSIANQAKS